MLSKTARNLTLCFGLAGLGGCATNMNHTLSGECLITSEKEDGPTVVHFDKECGEHRRKETILIARDTRIAAGKQIMLEQWLADTKILAEVAQTVASNPELGLKSIVELREKMKSPDEVRATAAIGIAEKEGVTEEYLVSKQEYYENVLLLSLAANDLVLSSGEPNFAQYSYIVNELYTGEAFPDTQIPLAEVRALIDVELADAGTSIERLVKELKAYNASRPFTCEEKVDGNGNLELSECVRVSGYEINTIN
jgi:hypothetical protein